MSVQVVVAHARHGHHAVAICDMINAAAKIRGTGIAKRDPLYIRKKMEEGHAIIALDAEDAPVGFCYIESWEEKKYVANSGLIVHPDYRNSGLAKTIKKEAFKLSKAVFPEAKLFGITTSLAVMKINTELGYQPVTFSELTQDETFWKGCQSCTNYDVLQRTHKKMCLCTGMMCDLSKIDLNAPTPSKKKAWERLQAFLVKRKSRMEAFGLTFSKFKKNTTPHEP